MNKMTILVPAHDSYFDVAEIFFRELKNNWNNCSYPIVWTNEKLTFDNLNIKVINNGENSTFCGRIKNALKFINSEYILLILEDFIITERVDMVKIEHILSLMKDNDFLYCNLFNKFGSKNLEKNRFEKNIYRIKSNTPYGISINVGIFKKDFLNSLLKNENWNGWELENYLLFLSQKNKIKRCIYAKSNPLHVEHLIYKGKIIPKAKKNIERKNISLSNLDRESLSAKEIFENSFKCILSKICPIKMRGSLKKIGKKIGIKFITNN